MITGWQSRLLPLGNRVYHYPTYGDRFYGHTVIHHPSSLVYSDIFLDRGDDALYGFGCDYVTASANFDLNINTMILGYSEFPQVIPNSPFNQRSAAMS